MLLLGAVAFWWGAVLAPRLVSQAFPAWLPVDLIWHLQLDPEQEGSLANAASAATFAVASLLALGNAIVSWRKATGRIAVGGWAVLAVVIGLLAWNEISDVHNVQLQSASSLVFGIDQFDGPWTQLALVSPMIVVFALAMWLFLAKVLPGREARILFALGLGAWLLGLIFDAMHQPLLILHRASGLASIAEEMLEISGALLIGLSAAIAMGQRGSSVGGSDGIRWRRLVAGAVATVAVPAGLAAVFVFQVPIVDARAPSYSDVFILELRQREGVVQHLRMPAFPIGRIDLRLDHRDPAGRGGSVGVRFHQAGRSPELTHGSVAVPANDGLRRRSIDLEPPLAEAEGLGLTLAVMPDIGREADLRVRAAKGDHMPDGRLWINGGLARPEQDLEFVAYTAPEPTRSKLQALWWLVTSDSRWLALLASLAFALTLITLTSAVLVASVTRVRGAGSLDGVT